MTASISVPVGAPIDAPTDAPVGSPTSGPSSAARVAVIAVLVLVASVVAALLVGPAGLPIRGVGLDILDRLPFVHANSGLSSTEQAILWQIRMPRIVLGGLVGWTLAASGAAYQGVFRNPLADPYLLGAAAGAGLGATVVIAYAPTVTGWPVDPIPLAAFAGALAAVAATYMIATGADRRASSATILLAGIAVAAFFTSAQTYVQQQNSESLRQVYSWILGRLGTSGWKDVVLVLPYVTVCSLVMLAHRRLLDVLRVGDQEASSLGVDTNRTRLIVVGVATLGTAAVVAVSGLIGFVGIIVPHTVRLTAGASYRRVLPLSMLLGASFLILSDLIARTVSAPAEVPIGVITAFFGAPFFLLVLRRRTRA